MLSAYFKSYRGCVIRPFFAENEDTTTLLFSKDFLYNHAYIVLLQLLTVKVQANVGCRIKLESLKVDSRRNNNV